MNVVFLQNDIRTSVSNSSVPEFYDNGEATEEDNNRWPEPGGEEEDQPLQRRYCVSLQDAMSYCFFVSRSEQHIKYTVQYIQI